MVDNKAETISLRVADLSQNAPTLFEIVPDAADLSRIAEEMDLIGLKKLRFKGEVKARGQRDFELRGHIGFTVVQPCVVSLEPVSTRVDAPVDRLFIAGLELPDGEEVEMTEDDTTEPLGSHIELEAVMLESLALNLPLYPRKNGAELGESVHAEPGVTPMRDEDTRPFAGLAALRDQLKSDE